MVYLGLVVPELAEVEKEVVVLGPVAADEAEFLDNVVDLAARALVRVVELGARRSVNANAAQRDTCAPSKGWQELFVVKGQQRPRTVAPRPRSRPRRCR